MDGNNRDSKLKALKIDLLNLQQRIERPHLGIMTRVTDVLDDYLIIADEFLDAMRESDERVFERVSAFITIQKEDIDGCEQLAGYRETLSSAKYHAIDVIKKTISLIDEMVE